MKSFLPVREDGEIIDGALIKALSYCKKNCNSGKCKRFYDEISLVNHNKFLTCPYGMSVYISHYDNNIHWFIGLREKQTYDRSKAARINKEESIYNPVLSTAQLLEIIEVSLKNEKETKVLEEKQASIDSISHEVKKLNAQIKDRSDVIIQSFGSEEQKTLSPSEFQEVVEKIKTIFVCSSMINARFALLNYEKNPVTLKQGSAFDCNIYKKFDKNRIIFSNYLGRKVPINLVGTSYRCIKAYPSFDMIPLLLIDNAVKYSYKGCSVEIRFECIENTLNVEVSSFSPYCSQNDIEHIFEKGYRGKNAIRVSDGSGIGLFFVKMVCDLHNIGISILSDSTKLIEHDGVAYAPFTVQLLFKNTFLQQE